MKMPIFEKLAKSGWVRWAGAAPFVALPVFIMFLGSFWAGLGILAFFGAVFGSVFLGRFLADLIADFTSCPPDIRFRLKSALGAFGFLFIPTVVGRMANSYSEMEFDIYPVWVIFLWASCVGFFFFLFDSPESKD